jgi:hypothetical protein
MLACLYVRRVLVYMDKHTRLYVFRVLQVHKSHTKYELNTKMPMLFQPKFHVHSNGALVFCWNKSNIMYRKMDKTIHGNCACIQPPFFCI